MAWWCISQWLRRYVPWEEKANGAKHKFPLELIEGIVDTRPGCYGHNDHGKEVGRVVPLAAPERIALIKKEKLKGPQTKTPTAATNQSWPEKGAAVVFLISWCLCSFPLTAAPTLGAFRRLGGKDWRRQIYGHFGKMCRCAVTGSDWCGPTLRLKLSVQVWTQARPGFCPQRAGLQPALEAWLVMGMFLWPSNPNFLERTGIIGH